METVKEIVRDEIGNVIRVRGFETEKEAALAWDMYQIFYLWSPGRDWILNFEDEMSKDDYYKLFMDDDYLIDIGIDPGYRLLDNPFFEPYFDYLKERSETTSFFSPYVEPSDDSVLAPYIKDIKRSETAGVSSPYDKPPQRVIDGKVRGQNRAKRKAAKKSRIANRKIAKKK
jgi:hypothetical protein